jgi:hypothetical protein
MKKLIIILLCGAITMPSYSRDNSGALVAGAALGYMVGNAMREQPNTTMQYHGESDDATWALYDRPDLFQRREQGQYIQNGNQYGNQNGDQYGNTVEYVSGCNPHYRTDYAVGYNNQRIPYTHFVGCW